MPHFLLEPKEQRIAISAPHKVACLSIRMWLWELAYECPWTGSDIFADFARLTVDYKSLPDTLEVAIAVHRDGVSRMRAIYDHRIVQEREAPDNGLDHFARHLPEYCQAFPLVAHHCTPQSQWLGSDPEVFSHVVPLSRLELVREIVRVCRGGPCRLFLTRTRRIFPRPSVMRLVAGLRRGRHTTPNLAGTENADCVSAGAENQ